jgi:hypothetical protein
MADLTPLVYQCSADESKGAGLASANVAVSGKAIYSGWSADSETAGRGTVIAAAEAKHKASRMKGCMGCS